MTTMSEAGATPVPVEINGKTILAHPLQMAEWAMMEDWMRERLIEAAANVVHVSPFMSETVKSMIVDRAFKAAQSVSLVTMPTDIVDRMAGLTEEELNRLDYQAAVQSSQFLGSLGGMMQICWLSLRKNFPRPDSVQPGMVGHIIRDLDDLNAYASKVLSISRIRKNRPTVTGTMANFPATASPTPGTSTGPSPTSTNGAPPPSAA